MEMIIIVIAAAGIWLFSDLLGRGTNALGQKFKIPGAVRGATMDAIGSSFPELCTVIFALLAGSFEAGLGAIVGSALFNVLVIPAASAWIVGDLHVRDKAVVRRDGMMYLAVVVALIVTIWLAPESAGELHQIPGWVGLVALACYAGYVALLFMQSRSGTNDKEEECDYSPLPSHWTVAIWIFVGIVGIGFSTHFLVESALTLFQGWGLPDALTGVTLLAAATSLPDTLLSVFAARRGDSEGAISNALGSNTFDILICLGLPIFVMGGVEVNWVAGRGALGFLLASTIMVIVFLITGWKLTRQEGAVMGVAYGLFLILAFSGLL